MRTLLLFLVILIANTTFAQKKTYEYDDLNRLIKAHYWDGNVKKFTVTYGYDEVGNRLSKTVTVICTTPTAALSGTQTINEGQNAQLSVSLTGDTPYNLTVNGQAYSNITATPYNFSVSPITTTTYSISQIANNCGVGTASGNAVVTVIPACQQPDLIISDIIVTKYSSDKVYYRVVVKNVGNQTVSLGNFSFSTYGSTDALKDNSDILKHTMFLGGGSLAKDQTINYDVFASIDYKSPQHYFVLLADSYAMIPECNESNNTAGKLIKPCTNGTNTILTGLVGPGLKASQGRITLTGATLAPNTTILASNIVGTPVTPINSNNINLVIGTCSTDGGGFLPNNSIQPSPLRSTETQQRDLIEFLDKRENQPKLYYKVNDGSIVSINIWDMSSKSKLKNISNEYVNSGEYRIDFSKYPLQKGGEYIVHFETEKGSWAKVIEW